MRPSQEVASLTAGTALNTMVSRRFVVRMMSNVSIAGSVLSAVPLIKRSLPKDTNPFVEHDPQLPSRRPLMIAHRAGNDLEAAKVAASLGADLIEADVWRSNGRLVLRHSMGIGKFQLPDDFLDSLSDVIVLEDLLDILPSTTGLFLDLKGHDLELPEQLISTIEARSPGRQIIVCGRTWAQIDSVVNDPNVVAFYSVANANELANVWTKLAQMDYPAISIHVYYLQPALIQELKEVNATIFTWPIETLAMARRYSQLEVDGLISDNLELINDIVGERSTSDP